MSPAADTVGDMDVAAVLADVWGINRPVGEPHRGSRRWTWQVGDVWLAGTPDGSAEPLERECRLLQALADLATPFETPRVVKTCGGELFVRRAGWTWRLTTPVRGRRVDNRDPRVWGPVFDAVVGLDEALAALPHDLAVRRPGIVESARAQISMPWTPVTSHPRERHVLAAAVEWLTPRLGDLEALPRQVIHGDCHTPNVILDAQGAVRGFIDLEFSSVDPVEVELAAPAANLVFDSCLDAPVARRRLRDVLPDPGTLRLVETALVATRLNYCWHHRDRLAESPDRDSIVGVCVEFLDRALQFAAATSRR